MHPIILPLAVTFGVQAVVAVALYSAPVMAPAAAPDFGVAPATVGYFVVAAYVGSMLGTLTAGGLVARFGPIRVSQAGLAACMAGLALLAFAPRAPAPVLALGLAALAAFLIG